MGFFKRLLSGGGSAPSTDDTGLHVYVKCKHCGAPVHVRINLQNELAADYGDTAAEGYQVVKEITDDRCFRRMRAELHFDARKRETSREIEGGEFISEEAYESLRAAQTGKPA